MSEPEGPVAPVNPFAAPGHRQPVAPVGAHAAPDGRAPSGWPETAAGAPAPDETLRPGWGRQGGAAHRAPGVGYPEPALAPVPWSVDSTGRPVAPPRERGGLRAWVLVPMIVLALVAGAVGGVLGSRWTADRRPADAALPTVAGGETIRGDLTGVAAIAAAVQPSVVTIEVRGDSGESTGSGFVLRADGYLLTNSHVVSADVGGSSVITVVFADGSESEARLVGATSDYDLAVLKVDRTGLTPLVLGDSDTVVVGDPVVAVGAPLGLQGTVTTGIVSALHRPVTAGDASQPAFIDAIQTDAAINPGNSGGPLVDASGEVIGINSAIAQASGSGLTTGSIGLGFSIPSNQARRTAEQLIETGVATYPVIGVLLDSRYTGEGVQVATETQDGSPSVIPDGPAERAGIVEGDIILAIDGWPVTDADELIVAIRAKAPGDSVTLSVRSGSSTTDVRVVLDEVSSS
ncbi:S1C family serine protease [Actinotalea sp.]|uniref:S1C family serine protease n=1 Tax=Actinotalea sp. TaxID=1872145 RepID=UPI003568BC7D